MPNEEMGGRAAPQPPDVSHGVVLAATGGFLAFVALMMIGMFVLLRTEAPRALRQRPQAPFPQPSLQTDPHADLKRFLDEQRAELTGYAWIDREQGLAKIPIEEAMRIVAARGAHAYDPLQPSVSLDGRGGRP